MKKACLSVITCLFVASVLCQSTAIVPAVPKEVQQWVSDNFAKGKVPPFSFQYGGRPSATFIKGWHFQAGEATSLGPHSTETIYTYSSTKAGLRVKCVLTCFTDFPAVEWTLHFSNLAEKNTSLITNVNVVDHSFNTPDTGTFTLYRAKGSNAERSDFQPIITVLKKGDSVYFTPSGGRSSDNAAFPFFNIQLPGNKGIMAAIGWTGKWFAAVKQENADAVTLQSGMERISLYLLPGEEIRTPRVCLLFWSGNSRMAGHNQFRRFVLAHHSRKVDGIFAEYPLSGSFDFGDPHPCWEYECLTQDYAIALVKRYQQFGIIPEVFWLDAGWYKGCNGLVRSGSWWVNVGNWAVEKERFPGGLKAVSDVIHAAGSKFMVWFEPERVWKGTDIDQAHPEWLIRLPGNDSYLFNLGNKQALQWMTSHIGDLLESEGIDYYRQDFNMDPLPYWEANDPPGRTGISEIRHIEGLYAFWDSLLTRFPGLLIDNCASGGRRIDLETTSRSAPFWRTDYLSDTEYGEPNGRQAHTYGLNFYLPLHGTGVSAPDPYSFRSGLSATVVTGWEITGKHSAPLSQMQQRIRDFKRLRPYFYGDYYPLTGSSMSDDAWLAYQLFRPEEKDGIIVAFRREQSNKDSITVKLSGLSPSVYYELYYEDYGIRTIAKGSELMKGWQLGIPGKPGSLLISYKEEEK